MPVYKLIEKQQAMWDLKHRLESTTPIPGRYVEGGVGWGPCLLISRECGAGGADVARLTGRRLGWQVYDREIVDQISELVHARQQLIQSVDERVRSSWESAWREVLFPDDIGSEKYLRFLHQVVLTLGHHGDVIVLGRGAQYLLPRPCALCIRLVAPREQRVKRVMEDRKITLADAQAFVRQCDAERLSFIRKFFHSDAASPLNYDMVLNMGEMTPPTAAETVLAALHAKLGVRPCAEPRMKDEG